MTSRGRGIDFTAMAGVNQVAAGVREVFVQSSKKGLSGASEKSPHPSVLAAPLPSPSGTLWAQLSDKPVNQMTDNRKSSWKHLLVKG